MANKAVSPKQIETLKGKYPLVAESIEYKLHFFYHTVIDEIDKLANDKACKSTDKISQIKEVLLLKKLLVAELSEGCANENRE